MHETRQSSNEKLQYKIMLQQHEFAINVKGSTRKRVNSPAIKGTYITQLQTHVVAKVPSLGSHLVGAHLQKVLSHVLMALHTNTSSPVAIHGLVRQARHGAAAAHAVSQCSTQRAACQQS